MSKKLGELVVRRLFGAVLADQGRGFYVGLELLAILRGTYDHTRKTGERGTILPAEFGSPLRLERRSHDFARRLMSEPRALEPREVKELGDAETIETLAALARGLRVPIPGRRRRPPWHGEHLQPYVGELIHYDAVFRKGRKSDGEKETLQIGADRKRVSIERYLYRGAGGLAHAILRTDGAIRLASTRESLLGLVSDSKTPLGDLFRALGTRDRALDERFEEIGERDCIATDGGTGGFDQRSPWVELLRAGVSRIAGRDLPRAKRVEALMHWVPYCLARYEADVARHWLEGTADGERLVTRVPIPIDLGTGPGPIRRRSREVHERIRADIANALNDVAAREFPDELAKTGSSKWREAARSFFSGTMAAVGGLNATTGKRHFVLGNELLESVLLATLDQEVSFERFCQDVLFDSLGLIVDKAAASRTDTLRHLDRSDFDANAEALANRLDTLGMLVRYSDQTRMVRPEVVS
ncbi:MAG: hypothetical protein IPM29_27780 [Planctomycetes bacterium]|nr:hypothetical protein [Planctomycetota bacterium]